MLELETTINALVYAGDSRDALAAASHDVYESLVRDGVFDAVRLYDHDRFEDADSEELPPVVTRADSNEGQGVIRDAWVQTVAAYRSALENVAEFTDQHDPHEMWMDQSVYDEYVEDFRRVGEERGKCTFLYDPKGEGIRTLPHLASVFEGSAYLDDVHDPDDFGLYVVPAEAEW